MNAPARWLQEHQLSCFYKKLLGVDCPGCGMQRAFMYLINGDFWESIRVYPPLLPILLTFVFMCFHLIFEFKSGAKILIYGYSISAGLIVINYLIKIICGGVVTHA
jgi:hypothetical protein